MPEHAPVTIWAVSGYAGGGWLAQDTKGVVDSFIAGEFIHFCLHLSPRFLTGHNWQDCLRVSGIGQWVFDAFFNCILKCFRFLLTGA